ncbi:TPA: hypothetical protein ACG3JU_003956, partial [Clostridioides difficile]
VHIFDRTIKKRRGCYSEEDIFNHFCAYPTDAPYYHYYGRFSLTSLKDIEISRGKILTKDTLDVYYIDSQEKEVQTGDTMRQEVNVQFIPDPTIIINNNLGVISDACSISYMIPDSNTSVRFKITEKLNDIVISEKDCVLDGNYSLTFTDEHLSTLSFNSTNNITIELSTSDGGKFLDKTVTFTKG